MTGERSSMDWPTCWAYARRVNGWLTEREGRLLYDTARCLAPGARIVEIGSFFGRSTVCIAYGALAASGSDGPPPRVFAIDPHIGSPKHSEQLACTDTYPHFLENLEAAGIRDVVEPIHKMSTEALDDVDGALDFLFIDGSHEREDVQKDFDLWFPRVKDDGYVAFHDSWHMSGVRQVTDRILGDSTQVRDPKLVDTITRMRKSAESSAADRKANRRFRTRRRWSGLPGFLRLTYRGTLLAPAAEQPGAAALRARS